MKKLFAIALAALLAMTFCAALAQDALPDALIMGFDSAYPPMTFTDEDGSTYIGFDIDVAKEVCARLGIELIYEPINWDTKEEELDTARSIDCIWSGLTMTDALKERFAFSIPYMTNEQILIVRTDSGITSIDELAGKMLGTQAGSSSMEVLDENPDFKASLDGGEAYTYEDFQMALLDLANGNLDVVLVDSVVANDYISKQADQSAFTILPEMLLAEEYGIAFRQDDAALAEAVSAQLVALYADGTLDALKDKWGANDVTIVGQYADVYGE